MPLFKRVFLIVLDSVGIGAAPDADLYDDVGAHTLKHIAESLEDFSLPNLQSLWLGHIDDLPKIKKVADPQADVTKRQEASVGKDTMTGHWELMGLNINRPFLTYPDGFPFELIEQLEKRTNRQVIGNKVASGTVIIEELGIK